MTKGKETTEKKDYHLRRMGDNIAVGRKQKLFFMDYKSGLKMIKKNKDLSLIKKKQRRHVSLPYHLAGKNATNDAIKAITDKCVGKYRPELKGIIMAVGDVEIMAKPRCLADQNVFHMEVMMNQIVFTPEADNRFEAKVRYIENDIIVAIVMDIITFHVKANEKTSSDGVDVDDVISIKYSGIRIKQSLCLLQGTYESLVEKAAPVKDEVKEEEEAPEDENVADEDDE